MLPLLCPIPAAADGRLAPAAGPGACQAAAPSQAWRGALKNALQRSSAALVEHPGSLLQLPMRA